MPRFMLELLATEAAYFIFVFILCSLIHLKTKEIYELTAEKSVRYFRNSFLFLGLAYFSRSLLYLLISWGVLFEIPPQALLVDFRTIAVLSGFLLVYFGSLSILYLSFSLVWDEFDLSEALMHLLAITVALVITFFRSFELLVISQIALFFLLAIAIYSAYRASEVRKSFWGGIYPLYLLLFVFWILNVLVLVFRTALEVRVCLYLASSLILAYIAYRILKKVG